MLSLQSPRWNELQHAYGRAGDIPALLLQLRECPESSGRNEPWFTLWSALAHQGDVYSASFAAVPHVIASLASAPTLVDESYFQFPAWVEICRARSAKEIPDDLKEGYFAALGRLPEIVAKTATRPWTPEYAACALAAISAAKGHHALAEAILEMTSPNMALEVVDWFAER